MGWHGWYGASRKDLIAENLRRCEGTVSEYITEALRHCLRGNVLWVLRETSTPQGVSRRVTRWIDCIVLQRDNRSGDWLYKPIDESMGPCYYTCPLAYLDAASAPSNKNAAEWRQAVREWHTEKKAARKAWRSRNQLTMEV